ncbi:hypothetical protein [Arthrobacter sp. NPDC093139]|uniref:hypothetical protein n=1 Tax=Arthrobacter sp. NPDC093139 TaxID=3363945 RepID=UPI003813DB99
MNRQTFVRAFRASTGATPSAWIRTRRLDAARQSLFHHAGGGLRTSQGDSGAVLYCCPG